ncbi:DUF2726 domain-containing protein [Marinobacterium jannaschii]|uniref:DUF2726 domain-containing protein n=1 Tax=Marinobacterium jannaschii TaxID=64970 RepID=UPI0004824822|nr:DUF2726 domain-containing protein [Marinobacterium jannaschii]
MEWILLPLVIFAVLMVLLKAKANSENSADTTDQSSSLGYRPKGALFTPAERSFLGVLDQVVDNRYRVFGKVRVADLIEPQPSRNRSQWQRAFNAISSKHFDFVICKAGDLTPVCVIELDDKSHNAKKRQQRDQFLGSVCKDAELPLIRFSAKQGYQLNEVKARLAESLVHRNPIGQCK